MSTTIEAITGLPQKDAEAFERAALVAAVFRLCDPLATMENLKLGDTVRLKSGGPVMTLGKEMATGGWRCDWFEGKTAKRETYYLEQLEKADPQQPSEPPGSYSTQAY